MSVVIMIIMHGIRDLCTNHRDWIVFMMFAWSSQLMCTTFYINVYIKHHCNTNRLLGALL